MAIAIRQSLGGEINHAVYDDFFGLLTLYIFSLSAKRGFDSERWFTMKYKQDGSISRMSSSLDLSSSTTCHNRTIPSSPALVRYCPLGLNFVAKIGPSCA